MVRTVVALGLLALLPGPLLAGTAPPVLPAAVLDLLRDNPRPFLGLCENVIAGFGTKAGLTEDRIEAAIGLTRAEARATAMRRFWAMGLNGGGGVTSAERDVVPQASSAAGRAHKARAHARADRDGDGEVAAEEVQQVALEEPVLRAVGL